MKLQSFLQMLLYAGLPFVLSAVICTSIMRHLRRTGEHEKRERGKVAQWAERNKLSLAIGAAFLTMLLIAAVVGLICIKLSAAVQTYYIICGIAMGAVAGAAYQFIMRNS